MEIKFLDLKAQYLSIKNEIDNSIMNTIEKSSFIKGKNVENFEKNFAKTIGVKHCISVANGTDSLFIIMKMLGIGVGDEVITSSYSWISSSETISLTGAKPIFIDIEDDYFTIDTKLIENKITSKTKAIVAVHIQGQSCDINDLQKICDKYNIFLIEDCAQAHLSEFNNRYVGSFGIASSFSFFPGKNLGAFGDAGAILTDNDEYAKKFRMFANHGSIYKHEHKIEGINSRMDGIQAGILNVKLKYLKKWTNERRKIAHIYDKIFSKSKYIRYPKVRKNTCHAYHLYVIRVNYRDMLKQYLKNLGIQTAIHYPRALPNLDCYKNLSNDLYPIATANQKDILSIPIDPMLSHDHATFVAKKIVDFYEKKLHKQY